MGRETPQGVYARASGVGALEAKKSEGSLSADQHIPAVGAPISMAVQQAPSRTTLFPEQFVVAASPNDIQIAMLRFEMVPISQQGVVNEVGDDGGFGVEVQSTAMNGLLFDIGHLRVSPETARGLAALLIEHLVRMNRLDLKAFSDELTVKLSDVK